MCSPPPPPPRHLFAQVGVVFGSPDVTSGGNALKFYASIRLEIKKTGVVKGKGENEVVGNLIRVKIAKNKMAPPFRVADFEMTYGKGVSVSGEVVDLGLACGVLEKSGAWYAFKCPETVLAINTALQRAGGFVAEVEEPSSPPPTSKPKSGVKGGAAANKKAGASSAAREEEEAGNFPPPPPPSSSEAESVQVGQPFAQGRDKAKAWFEGRPGAMEAAAAAVKLALKRGGPGKVASAPGALAAVGLAVSPLPGVASLEDELGPLGEQ